MGRAVGRVRPEHTDPGFALWVWCRVQLDRDALPPGRVVIGFTFPDERVGNRRFWLLVADGDAEVCVSDPGGEPAAEVVARSGAFIDWHRGVLPWRAAVRAGTISVEGDRVDRAQPADRGTWAPGDVAATS